MATRRGARAKPISRTADAGSENVFLTWSGPRSKQVAEVLKKWLPEVIQQCRPWMSKDIEAGKRWRGEIKQRLNSISVGVLCLTKENVGAAWVNFEAGALSKSVPDESRVIPYCFGIKPTDYKDPLGDFQGVIADRDGTWSLVRSVNSAMPAPVDDPVLQRVFDRSWGDLEADLKKIPKDPVDQSPPRSVERMVEETLTRVRQLEHGKTWNPYDLGPPGPLAHMFGQQAALSLRELADLSDRGVKMSPTAVAQVQAYKEGLRAAADETRARAATALGVDLKDMRAPDASQLPDPLVAALRRRRAKRPK